MLITRDDGDGVSAMCELGNPYSDGSFTQFIGRFVNIAETLYIEPKEQVDKWTTKVGNRDVGISATGVWHAFGDQAENFVMQGLSGCTAIIIISSKGLWAGHLWESSSVVFGPSAHLERYALGVFKHRPRPTSDFKKLGVDILGTRTPPRVQKDRPLWKSLVDLQQDHGDPFAQGTDVEIFVLTQAKGIDDGDVRFRAHIDLLRSKLEELIPGARYTERTYIKGSPIPPVTMGVIAVQYSPYDHDEGSGNECTRQARARVFYENNKQSVIDKSWTPNQDQGGVTRKRDACEPPQEAIDWPIKQGYVAFGDSFAAGMGTGTTTSDSCRIGSANIGDLINAFTNDPNVDYQRRMCSGDTTVGLDRQIKEWKSPEKADVATLTIGGNDLGFSDIVSLCVLSFTWDYITSLTTRCNNAKKKARQLVRDTSDSGIGTRLVAAYTKILEKSTRKDFHLYVSGYPSGFFNAETEDCENGVAAEPQGDLASKLREANNEIAAKNFTGQSIGWFSPTRQIKTFHPRTPGMIACRDSIIAAINLTQSVVTADLPVFTYDPEEPKFTYAPDQPSSPAPTTTNTDGLLSPLMGPPGGKVLPPS
ncbi:unnamed protein product [Zymoseptoria tritici ST99CH_3D1]|nr:unnamed protein product [Zymoseptoria tritici ST99CH_3D1]